MLSNLDSKLLNLWQNLQFLLDVHIRVSFTVFLPDCQNKIFPFAVLEEGSNIRDKLFLYSNHIYNIRLICLMTPFNFRCQAVDRQQNVGRKSLTPPSSPKSFTGIREILPSFLKKMPPNLFDFFISPS